MEIWKEMRIGDLCDTISFTYKRNDDEVILINTSDVLEGKVLNHTKIPNINLKGQFKKTFQKDDILYSEIRPANKRYAYIDFAETSLYVASTKLMVLRPKTDIVYPKFLYDLLTSNSMLEEMQHLAETRSGTFPQITFSTELSPYRVRVPSMDEQIKIVNLLDVIEEKIEINNALNKNLAEQSQAILSMFMDNYPYTSTPLGEMSEIIDCLHSKKPNVVDDTTFQLLQLNNITDTGFLDLSQKYNISKSDYDNWTRKCEIVAGDCVITNVGRIGAVSQAPAGTHAAMGRNMTCIRLKEDYPFHSYLITTLLSNYIRNEIMKNTDEGTIMGALNVKNIPLLLFPKFESPIMNQLEEILSPIRTTIEQNFLSNQTLAQIRDTLLPKLMSGELDVSDIYL